MPKSINECVTKLLQDPKFNPKIGHGKADKSKEEIARAICAASIKGKENCMLCEIEDDVLFKEALEEIIKQMTVQKNINQFTENITAQLTIENTGINRVFPIYISFIYYFYILAGILVDKSFSCIIKL